MGSLDREELNKVTNKESSPVNGSEKKFRVLTGAENSRFFGGDEAFCKRVMEIDEEVYGQIDEGFVGTLENMVARYRQNRESFVCLVDGDVLVGYINFFPLCDKVFDQIVGPCIHPDMLNDKPCKGFDPESGFRQYVRLSGEEEDSETEKKTFIPDIKGIKEHFLRIHDVSELSEDNKTTKIKESKDDSKDDFYKAVIDFYNTCRDDDILPEEINKEYSKDRSQNNIFIISVAVRKEYRGKNTSIKLTEAFIDFLRTMAAPEKKGGKGTPINSISAICVSEGGEKFLRGLNFYFHRELARKVKDPVSDSATRIKIMEDLSDCDVLQMTDGIRSLDELGTTGIQLDYHERVYLCWGYYLDRLTSDRLYHKTHKDDIYLFVPLAENPENTKIDELIEDFEKYAENHKKLNEDEGQFFFKGVIPGSEEDKSGKKKTQKLLDFLQYYADYEYNGFLKKDLDRIYLGECLFRHTTDRYFEDDVKEDEKAVYETVGEEKADLLLLAYRIANMYVLVIYLPECRYSSSMVGDQLSKMKLECRVSSDDFGFFEYKSIIDVLKDKYNLVTCGAGKAFYCMNKMPENAGFVDPEDEKRSGKHPLKEQELMNILTGETFFSVHQDFYIRKYEKLKEQLCNDLAIYDYYQAYMSPVSLVMILDTFDEENCKEEDAATYVFIVELVLLQNTALTKLSKKVGVALEHEGDVPYEYISQQYKDYGRTLKLWDASNFKYYGTQMEAEQIRQALGNDELRERYEKEQEFLDKIVDVNLANDERKNGWLIGAVGMVLTVFQVFDFVHNLMAKGIGGLAIMTGHPESIVGVTPDQAEGVFEAALDELSSHMFTMIVFGAFIFFVLFYIVNRKRKKYEQRLVLHSEKDSDNWED